MKRFLLTSVRFASSCRHGCAKGQCKCRPLVRSATTSAQTAATIPAQTSTIRPATVVQEDERKLLQVQWTDGSQSRFSYAWLRDNAPEPHTFDFGNRNRSRLMLMSDFDPNTKPVDTQVLDDGSIKIKWSSDDTTATYTPEWLLKRNLSDAGFREQRINEYHSWPKVTWGSQKIKDITEKPASWQEMMNDDRYLRDQLCRFLSYGLLYVKGVPEQPDELSNLGTKMGYLLNSHYGKQSNATIFGVYAESDPSNLMNTTRALGLHTDFPQYQQCPEVQVLHFVRQAGEGGDSQFCDGFRIAKQLSEEKPDLYKALITYPIEFLDWGREHYDFQFAAKWRTIETDDKGDLKGIFLNNAIRSWFYDAPPEEISKVIEGLKAFNDYCYQPRNLLNIKMKAGDMMWFANTRALHGRSAFTPSADSSRMLEGTYMNYDLILSKIRVINEKYNETEHVSL